MNKVCCVGDADICPKSSSCSMVLRSACSHHKHSRESSTVKESRAQTPSKSKSSSSTSKATSNGRLHIESVLESSLKQLALKSAKRTYSLLKGGLYNHYEFSENTNHKIYQTTGINLSCAKELHFDYLSSSSENSAFGSSLNFKECNSDYSSASESDFNSSESMKSTSKMPRLTRSALSCMRSLSGSEGEEDISVERVIRPRRLKSFATGITSNNSLSGQNVNSHIFSNSHSSYSERHNDVNNHFISNAGGSEFSSQSRTPDPSQLDISTVQYSSRFDRFRWFLWRCTYLKIIKSVNFDVWFLSRLYSYGKWSAIFFFLLPLLLYLTWGVIPLASVKASVKETYDSVPSFKTAFSPVMTSLYSYFDRKGESVVESSTVSDTSQTDNSPGLLSYFKDFWGFSWLSLDWFAKLKESASSSSEAEYESKISAYQLRDEEIQQVQHQPTKEEIRLIAIEVLRDEINFIKELQKSESYESEINKLEKEQKIQNEIKTLRQEFQAVIGTVGKLETEIIKHRENRNDKTTVITLADEHKKHIDGLNIKLKTIEAKLGVLEGLKTCCDKQWNQEDILLQFEKNLIAAFRNVMDGDYNPDSKYYFFNQWLNSKFFTREKLMQEINAALKRQASYQENTMNYDNVIEVVESTILKYVDKIKRNLTDISSTGYFNFDKDIFSEDKIKKIVKEAIMLYDADKTGQVDYALESGGGSVLGTRCSETYVEKYGKLSIFGVPLWTNSNSPRTAIQPDVHPGRCWAFKGSQGFLVLELSATIYPTGFTLEHIPVSLSPSGSVDSAPKNFSVWGLESEKDSKGNLLGEYWYDINGEPLQYFAVKIPSVKPYSYIELQIHSNHGNLDYTCLYRFRVHGKRV